MYRAVLLYGIAAVISSIPIVLLYAHSPYAFFAGGAAISAVIFIAVWAYFWSLYSRDSISKILFLALCVVAVILFSVVLIFLWQNLTPIASNAYTPYSSY